MLWFLLLNCVYLPRYYSNLIHICWRTFSEVFATHTHCQNRRAYGCVYADKFTNRIRGMMRRSQLINETADVRNTVCMNCIIIRHWAHTAVSIFSCRFNAEYMFMVGVYDGMCICLNMWSDNMGSVDDAGRESSHICRTDEWMCRAKSRPVFALVGCYSLMWVGVTYVNIPHIDKALLQRRTIPRAHHS